MITQAGEWEYTFKLIRIRRGYKQELELELQRKHVLFPPILAGQFIPGSLEYIPLYHDDLSKRNKRN